MKGEVGMLRVQEEGRRGLAELADGFEVSVCHSGPVFGKDVVLFGKDVS